MNIYVGGMKKLTLLKITIKWFSLKEKEFTKDECVKKINC